MANGINLFNQGATLFKWEDARTWLVRMHFNEVLQEVLKRDNSFLSSPSVPNYYNKEFCLALSNESNCLKRVKERGKEYVNTLKSADNCLDENALLALADGLLIPQFEYVRELPPGNPVEIPNTTTKEKLNYKFSIKGLTLGAVIWLYHYEEMGIFKILGALLDDYNYHGKLPLSGNVGATNGGPENEYSPLLDMVSTLYRIGIGSNIKDRASLYKRVLGMDLPGYEPGNAEPNTGFKKAFDAFNAATSEYYKAKQLAQAIQSTTVDSVRSSVATQTTIRDTVEIMQKNFEVLKYGRSQINAFLGIATVYATICLIRMLRDEIGVPRQYETPDEFIPAAHAILVLKRKPSSSTLNRFTVYDNCATYGYRLLTDIQLADPQQLTKVSLGSKLDLWLNNIEGWVEGYANARRQAAALEADN